MADNIKVGLRVRPVLKNEKLNTDLRVHWKVQNNFVTQVDARGQPTGEQYCFDHVFDENSKNKDVYEAVVKELVMAVLSGFNATLFVYGQTSSGKTHTMLGSDSECGVMQYAVHDLFKTILARFQNRYLIRVSYIELYKEKINDLLDLNNVCKIREESKRNFSVNCKEEIVDSMGQVFQLMTLGNTNRQFAATDANYHSSRSHTIFKIVVECNDVSGARTIAQLNLVDLAGSERIAQTNSKGERLKEGAAINKSLMILNVVMRQLSERQEFTSFRSEKLTTLLINALGGNSKSTIIANIAPTYKDDSNATISFALGAKTIQNKPIQNENVHNIQYYQNIILQHRAELANLNSVIDKLKKRSLSEKVASLHDKVTAVLEFAMGPIDDSVETRNRKTRRHTIGHHHPGANPISLDDSWWSIQKEKTVVDEDIPERCEVAIQTYEHDIDIELLMPMDEIDQAILKQCEDLKEQLDHLNRSFMELRSFTSHEHEMAKEYRYELETFYEKHKHLQTEHKEENFAEKKNLGIQIDQITIDTEFYLTELRERHKSHSEYYINYIKELQEKLDSKTVEPSQSLTYEVESLTDKLNKQIQLNAECDERIFELTEEIERYESEKKACELRQGECLNDLQGIRSELTGLLQLVSDHVTVIDKLSQENYFLKSQNVQTNSLNNQKIADLQKQIEALQQVNSQLNLENENLREQSQLVKTDFQDHKEKYDSMQEIIQRKNDDLTQLTKKFNTLKTKSQELHEQQSNTIQEKNQQIEMLQLKLNSSEDSVQLLNSKLMESQKKCNGLLEDEGLNKIQCLELQKEIIRLNNDLALSKHAIKSQGNTIQEKNDELDHLTCEYEKMKSDFQQKFKSVTSNQTVDQLKSEIDTLKGKMQLDQETCRKLQENEEVLHSKCIDFENEIKDLNKIIENMKSEQNECTDLKQEIKKLNKIIETMESEQNECSNLKEEIKKLNEIIENMKSLQKECTDLKHENLRLNQIIENMKSIQIECRDLKQENIKLNKLIENFKSLQEECTNLKDENIKLNQINESMKSLQKECTDLKHDNLKLNQIIENTKSIQKECNDLKHENTKLNEIINNMKSLKKECNDLKHENIKLNQIIKNMKSIQKECNDLKHENTKLNQKVENMESLQKERNDLKHENIKLNEIIDKIKSEKKDTSETHYQEEIKKLTEANQKMKDNFEVLLRKKNAEMVKIQVKLFDAQNLMTERCNEIEDLKNRLKEAKGNSEKHGELKVKFAELETNYTELQKKYEMLKALARHRRAELLKMQGKDAGSSGQ